jgi:hypothetical protein
MDAFEIRLEAIRLGVQLASQGHWDSIGQRLGGALAAATEIEKALTSIKDDPPVEGERQPDGMGGFSPAEPTPSSPPQGGD